MFNTINEDMYVFQPVMRVIHFSEFHSLDLVYILIFKWKR